MATGRDLTDINKTVLAKLEARTVLCKDYGSGSLATIAVLDAARRYARRHKWAIRSGAQSFVCFIRSWYKRLAEIRKTREQRPIEPDWEKILVSYGIRYQQYFTMSLVGEHIHRLMISSTEICYKTEQIMLASIPEIAVDDREYVKLFMGRMLKLMEAFDFLCSVTIRTTIRSEETIKQFGLAAKWFEFKCWEYFNKDALPRCIFWKRTLSKNCSDRSASDFSTRAQ